MSALQRTVLPTMCFLFRVHKNILKEIALTLLEDGKAQYFAICCYYSHLQRFYSLQKFDNKVHNIEQLVTKQKYGSLQKTLFHKIWLIRRETAFNFKLPFSALMILFFLLFSLYLALVLYCDFYYPIKGMNNLTMPVMQRVISATICFLFQVDTYIFKHMALKIVEHSIRVLRPNMSVCTRQQLVVQCLVFDSLIVFGPISEGLQYRADPRRGSRKREASLLRPKISLISKWLGSHVSDIKLIRTDTTL